MVACMPHARQLVRITVSRWMPNQMGSQNSSAKGIFLDRRLGTIRTVLDATSAGSSSGQAATLELQDKGGCLDPRGLSLDVNDGQGTGRPACRR